MKLSLVEVDEVIFVGGLIRIFVIRELVKSFIKKELNMSVNFDEVVVFGVVV